MDEHTDLVGQHFIVHGRVQGVFFRQSTTQTARQLGMTGWVKNLSDGIVSLWAVGEPASIAELTKWLSQGPLFAKVSRVNTTDFVDTEQYDTFSVR